MIRKWKHKDEKIKAVYFGLYSYKKDPHNPELVSHEEWVTPSWGGEDYWQTSNCRYHRSCLWYSRGELAIELIKEKMSGSTRRLDCGVLGWGSMSISDES